MSEPGKIDCEPVNMNSYSKGILRTNKPNFWEIKDTLPAGVCEF